MKIFKSIEPYFKFTKNERRGIIMLIAVLILVSLLKIIIPLTLSKQEPAILEIGYITLKEKVRAPNVGVSQKNTQKAHKYNNTKLKITLEKFEPNTATYYQLVNVGFSGKTANTIIKYRNAGGVFREPEDLFKVYGVDSSHGELIHKYCYIHDSLKSYTKKQIPAIVVSCDLNSANSEQLEKLPGIGAILGARIIKYRNLLGGFAYDSQLVEVYGIDEEKFLSIKKYIWADSSKVNKMNINAVSEENLRQHPYINNYQAKAIMKYRSLGGNFQTCKDLLDNNLLDEDDYKKISHYIEVH